MDAKQREAFGTKLLAHRKRYERTQLEIAKACNLDMSYYSKIEKGQHGVSYEMCLRICAAFPLPEDHINEMLFAAGFVPRVISKRISKFNGGNMDVLANILHVLKDYSEPELHTLYHQLCDRKEKELNGNRH